MLTASRARARTTVSVIISHLPASTEASRYPFAPGRDRPIAGPPVICGIWRRPSLWNGSVLDQIFTPPLPFRVHQIPESRKLVFGAFQKLRGHLEMGTR